MTFYDACKEIKDISFVDNIITGQTVKDRKQSMAILTVLETAQKGEAFSKEYVEQIRWERDIAISQLNEIGKSLGEKMNDVGIAHKAKWIEKRHGYLECSNCHCDTNKLDRHGYPIGQDIKHSKPKFCPHCGALMDDKETRYAISI